MSANNVNPYSDLDLGVTVRGLVPGQKVLKRYTLERVLGRGGMGVVWLAYDEMLTRKVALKFLPEVLAKDRTALDELKREAKRSLELSHPNIVRFFDFLQDETCAGISMEYVPGDSLANLRLDQPSKVFEVADIQNWVRQLCQALQYAHEEVQIVHRDLKPANLMVDGQGRLKVTDFGIARSVSDSVTRATMQHRGGVAGTLVYMSPQQAMGEPPSIQDDIYAMGATLYELLTSKPPFYSGEILAQVREKVPPPMQHRRRELKTEGKKIPLNWEKTIAACLQKEAGKRPASAWEVLERLGLEMRGPRNQAAAKPVASLSPEQETTVAEAPPPEVEVERPKATEGGKPAPPDKKPDQPRRRNPSRAVGMMIEIETEIGGILPDTPEPKGRATAKSTGTKPEEKPATVPPAETPPKSSKSTTAPVGHAVEMLPEAEAAKGPEESAALAATEFKPPTAAPKTTAPLPAAPPGTTAPAPKTTAPTSPPTVAPTTASAAPTEAKAVPPPTQSPVPEALKASLPAPESPGGAAPKTAEVEVLPPEPPPTQKPAPVAEDLATPIVDVAEVARETPPATPVAAPVPIAQPEPPAAAPVPRISRPKADERPAPAPEAVAEPPRKRGRGLKLAGIVAGAVALAALGIWAGLMLWRAANPPGELNVEVVSGDASTANAAVVLMKDGQQVGAMRGSPTFTQCAPGSYSLVVSNQGFEVATIPLTLESQTGSALAQSKSVKVPLSLLKGTLDLDVTPQQAIVEVESLTTLAAIKPVRKSNAGPAQLALPAGEYRVRWSCEGYRGQETNCVLDQAKSVAARAVLEPAFGGVEIASDPAGAAFVLNNLAGTTVRRGIAPKTEEKLPIGHYSAVLRLTNYDDCLITNLVVREDSHAVIKPQLVRSEGVLRFEARPGSVHYAIHGPAAYNGELADRYEQKLPTGEYEVELTRPGYHPLKRLVQVQSHQTNHLGLLNLDRITGSVRIDTVPPGAKLTATGGGETGKLLPEGSTVTLPVDTYQVTAALKGYEPAQESIKVEEGQPARKQIQLKRSTGILVLRLSADEAQATNMIAYGSGQEPATGGSARNVKTGDLVELPTGSYLLTLGDAHHRTVVTNFMVDAGKRTVLGPFGMEHHRGGFRLSYAPKEARVVMGIPDSAEIDCVTNTEPGQLNLSTTNLLIGEYRVVISLPGFESASFVVNIVAGQQVAVPEEVQLKRETGRLKVAIAAPAKVQIDLSGPEPLLPGDKTITQSGIGRDAAERLDLPTGRYAAKVSAAGYEPFSGPVEITKAGGKLGGQSLVRSTGALLLDTVPTGGAVSVRMVRAEASEAALPAAITGKAPLKLDALETGEYTVEATMPRASDWAASGARTWQVSDSLLIERQKPVQKTLAFPFGTVVLESEPPGARFAFGGAEVPRGAGGILALPQFGADDKAQFSVRLRGYKPTNIWVSGTGALNPLVTNFLPRIALAAWPGPQLDERIWTNSLGMPFVKLSDKVFICIWETRVRDYVSLVPSWMIANREKLKDWGRSERVNSNDQWAYRLDYLPVVMVNWNEATAFCASLTAKERESNAIYGKHRYRLPTDLEWSAAVGLPADKDAAFGSTPRDRSGKVTGFYSWGPQWPPLAGAGNYDGLISCDPFDNLAPVGVFRPNALGIYDLGGNVWEWCQDQYDQTTAERVVRGNSFNRVSNTDYSAAYRNRYDPGTRYEDIGFRCVIELGE